MLGILDGNILRCFGWSLRSRCLLSILLFSSPGFRRVLFLFGLRFLFVTLRAEHRQRGRGDFVN